VAIQIYKNGQGRYVRIGTAIAVVLVDILLAKYMYVVLDRQMGKDFTYRMYVEYGAPAIFFVGLAVLAALLLNKPSFVDFLIATESEMKKVSWSGKAELLGSTAVVIGTVFLLADIIFMVDYVFTGLMARGLTLTWDQQSWFERCYTAVHILLLIVIAGYLVRYVLESRMAAAGQVGRPGYGVSVGVAIALGAVWSFFWLVTGVRIPGMGLW
jgi:preprotein translocase SecE subunit